MAPLLSSSIDLMLFYAPAARSDARCGRQLRLRKSAVRSAADLCTRRRHCADSDVQLKAAKMHIRTYFTPTASKTGENDHWYVMWVHCKQTLINHVCAWTILSIRCKNSQYCPLDGHYVGSSRLSNESGMMPAHQQPRKAARIAAGMHPAAPGALSRTHGRRAETSPVTPKAKGETTLTFGQERQLGDSHATRTDVNPNPQVAEGLIQQQLGWSARKATGVDGCQK